MNNKLHISAIIVLLTAMVGIGISYGHLYAFHLAAIAFILFFLQNYKENLKVLPFSKKKLHSIYVLIFIIFWYLLSLFWAENKLLVFYHVFYLLNGLLIFIASYFAIRNEKDIKKFLSISGIIVGIEILISFLEVTGYFRWPISPYSAQIEFFKRNLAYNQNIKPEIIATIRKTPTGFHWNPNNLATYMFMVLPFFLFHKKTWVNIVFPVTIVPIIFFTGSRTVFIGLLIMAFFYIILYSIRKNIFIISILFSFLLIIFFVTQPYLKEKFNLKYNEITSTFKSAWIFFTTNHVLVNDSSSISIRQNLIQNGLQALKKSKGLGVGAGNSAMIQMKSNNTYGVLSMHNFWIEILVEGGIFIFILWIFWYFMLLRKSYLWWKRNIPYENKRFSAAISLSMIGSIISIISMSSAIYFLPFWLLLALAVRINDLNKNYL